MLANPSSATPVGPGRVKLVQVLDGDGPPPVPDGQAWGEVGVCEICLHVRDVQGVHDAPRRRPGGASLMAPMSGDVVAERRRRSTSPTSPTRGATKLEMIEWTGLWRSLPGPARAEGVNHVAFGVTDMARSRAFYERARASPSCCSSRSTSSTRWRRGTRLVRPPSFRGST